MGIASGKFFKHTGEPGSWSCFFFDGNEDGGGSGAAGSVVADPLDVDAVPF